MPSPVSLNLPMLSELSPGEVSLGVPVEDNAVQINVVVDKNKMGGLAIRVEEDLIRVSRDDSQELQIEVHEMAPDPFQAPERVVVLAKPIAELVLRRSPKENVWVAEGEGLDVRYEEGFDDFLSIVSGYALHKQKRQAEPSEAAS